MDSDINAETDEGAEKKVNELAKIVDQEKDRNLRLQAEIENIRKRSINDVSKARKFAIESFATNLLSVTDSLETALNTEDQTFEQLKDNYPTNVKNEDIIDEENSTIKDIDINCQVCWKPTDTKLDCDCKAHICRTCLTQAWSREYRGERPLNNKCPQCKKEGVKLIKANDEFVSMNHIIDLNYDDDKYNGQEKICLHVDCMQKLIEPALSRLNNLIYNSDDTSMDKSTSIENKKYDRSVRSMKLSQLTPIFLKNMKEFFQLKEISNEIEKTLNEVRDESNNMKNIDITINKFLQNKQENLKKLSRAEIKKVTESVPPLPDDATNFFFPNT